MQAKLLRQIGLVAAFLVPLGLLHAFVLAEIAIAVVDILFIIESVRCRNYSWMRKSWFILATLWWLWMVFCSTPLPILGFGTAGWRLGFVEALVIIRLPIFTAALQHWLLTTQQARRAAWLCLALSCVWIGLESWQQYLTGTNIFGNHRWGDGALTGPFWKPRAGPLYAHLLFTVLLPPLYVMLAKPEKPWRAIGILLAALGVVTSVLIGQRMGVYLTGLGLVTCAVFMPKLRGIIILCVVAGALVLLATPFISPATHGKLVGETARNFNHFSQSPYGQIFTRATIMGLQSPWHGWGYNGYRAACSLPRFTTGLPILNLPPTSLALAACILHPQNYYIEAFSESGFPGLILLIALMVVWTRDIGRNLIRSPDPLRVGLFISILTFTWPIASTDQFPTLYMLGWFFFLLGFALVSADIVCTSPSEAKIEPA